MSEWQPIETAPKDGTEIELSETPPFNKRPCKAFWHQLHGETSGVWAQVGGGYLEPRATTQWRPA